MFAIFIWSTTEARKKNQNMVMKTYKELLGTCIKSIEISIKSATKDSRNCFAIFCSWACQKVKFGKN